MSAATIRFDDVRAWLFEAALPLWASAGLDRERGGFVEQLTLEGEDAAVSFKRTRVQARQIYCYSHAELLGWQGPARETATAGWDFLQAHGRRADRAWVRRMGRSGGVVDPVADFYDLAFVLFAHAWRYRATGEEGVLRGGLETLDQIDGLLSDPAGMGWRAAEDAHGPRLQNPHMHLIEAAIEFAEASGHPRFSETARTVAVLFREKFFDSRTGTLAEYFEQDWSRSAGERGRITEPGHQFEWAWLLYRAEAVTGFPLRAEARALYDFAERHGVEPETGLTYDEVRDDGLVLSADHRTWPQTEALKANLAVFEHDGLDTRARIARVTSNLLDRYLDVEPRGSWIDHISTAGEPRTDRVPASTFYHVLLAFAELLRLEERLKAA